MSTSITLTVLLAPAGGGELPPGGATAEAAAGLAPDPRSAELVRDWFEARGFATAPLVGNAFAITAPEQVARATFRDLRPAGELSLERLPPALANEVRAVVAEPPLDFGPPSY